MNEVSEPVAVDPRSLLDSNFEALVYKALKFWFPSESVVPHCKPHWLNGMEVDFIVMDRDIAIEVQGAQHYLWVPKYQKTLEDFHKQKIRDNLKWHALRAMGYRVVLINCFDDFYRKMKLAIPHSHIRPLPGPYRKAIKNYYKTLNQCHNNAVMFKVKPNGVVIPTNRASAEWARRQNLQAGQIEAAGPNQSGRL